MLGFHMKRSNLANPNHTCIGGETFLSSEEKYPNCRWCKQDLAQILQLNHNTLPLKGSMFSTGVSRIFMCMSLECPHLLLKDEPQFIILQSDKELHDYNPGWSTYKEQTIDSLRVYDHSYCAKPCFLHLNRDDYQQTTRVVLDMLALGGFQYKDINGSMTVLDEIYFTDTEKGLKITGVLNYARNKEENYSSEEE